jgi:hypothetical protein
MNPTRKDWLKGHAAPLLAAAGVGVLFAVLAIVSQDGLARGYTSVLLLFVSLGLAILGFISGVVALAIGRLGTGFELLASSVVLPATFLLVLFAVRSYDGE